jgi:hypothetical protein
MKSPWQNLSQLKIIEFQNKIVTDEINTNEDQAIAIGIQQKK